MEQRTTSEADLAIFCWFLKASELLRMAAGVEVWATLVAPTGRLLFLKLAAWDLVCTTAVDLVALALPKAEDRAVRVDELKAG